MASLETTKIDELFRSLPKNSGIDPRLIEEARTELSVLKAHAETHRQKSWSKTETDKLKDRLLQKESEVAHLRRQMKHGGTVGDADGQLNTDRCVSIKSRYMSLYDAEWSDAYDFFKARGWTEVEIIVTLQRILRASYALCRDVAQEQLENLEGEALYPTASWVDDDGILKRMNQKQISREIAQIAKLYQNTTAQECLPALQKAYAAQVLPTFIDPTKFKSQLIENYSKSCVEVTWYMCVQDPPMVIVDRFERGSEFNPELFRKYTKYGGNKYDYLVWPALLLYQKGQVVVKGVAKTIPTRQATEMSGRSALESYRAGRSRDQSRRADDPDDEPEEEFDHQSSVFDRNLSRADRTKNVTPAKVYKKAPNRDEWPEPNAPYFDPHGRTDVPRIKVLPSTSDVLKAERAKRGHTNRKAATTYFGADGPYAGDQLTSYRKEERLPSAP